MTESEWLGPGDPIRLLAFMRRRTSQRKLRLLAVAGCRRLSQWFTQTWCLDAIDVAEQYADGRETAEELADAAFLTRGVNDSISTSLDSVLQLISVEELNATDAARGVAFADGGEAAFNALAAGLCIARVKGTENVAREEAALACLFREVFGNPFRPLTPNSSWLSWTDGTIPKLAQAIYEEHAFDRLSILADALEDAGCTDAAILAHCRSAGEHVRGCWVVDLLLGKE
jgi:hypothetical protein